MNLPPPARGQHDAIRELAGACYLAMRMGDPGVLHALPDEETLQRSGLAGTHANLCLDLGIGIPRERAIAGMQLAAANRQRWQALNGVLGDLHAEGIEPVLFKGGVLHARWPRMRELRAMSDYDLIVPQREVQRLRDLLARQGFETVPAGSRLTQRLCKGWMVWKGSGLSYQNLDIHARVTEPPVCSSLTDSILATRERADGVRVPDLEDCICMIALHVVRSGMHRPLREYIDLLWYVDGMDQAQWRILLLRARRHQLLPALFLSLRQALHCLALERLAPERAAMLGARIAALGATFGSMRMRALDWLAPPDYPLHPITSRDHPLFRRSAILGAGTGSAWRVCAAFAAYGAARLGDSVMGGKPQARGGE
jgi:hypothetical protein